MLATFAGLSHVPKPDVPAQSRASMQRDFFYGVDRGDAIMADKAQNPTICFSVPEQRQAQSENGLLARKTQLFVPAD